MKKAILDTLADYGRLSVTELSTYLGYSMPPSSLRNAINDLMTEGKISYTENGRRAPNQRLRLVVK